MAGEPHPSVGTEFALFPGLEDQKRGAAHDHLVLHWRDDFRRPHDKVFGQAGVGIFAAPTLTEREIRHQHRVELPGRAPEVRERFYAISVHRKLTHPMVRAIYDRPQTAAPLRAAAPGRSGKRRV